MPEVFGAVQRVTPLGSGGCPWETQPCFPLSLCTGGES